MIDRHAVQQMLTAGVRIGEVAAPSVSPTTGPLRHWFPLPTVHLERLLGSIT
jgi:hypothetical protein